MEKYDNQPNQATLFDTIRGPQMFLLGYLFAVFCPGLKKGMVLLEEKGHFCSRNYILRALSRAKLFYEGKLHKMWATHPMFEM